MSRIKDYPQPTKNPQLVPGDPHFAAGKGDKSNFLSLFAQSPARWFD
jgi:hypothetical protein